MQQVQRGGGPDGLGGARLPGCPVKRKEGCAALPEKDGMRIAAQSRPRVQYTNNYAF